LEWDADTPGPEKKAIETRRDGLGKNVKREENEEARKKGSEKGQQKKRVEKSRRASGGNWITSRAQPATCRGKKRNRNRPAADQSG